MTSDDQSLTEIAKRTGTDKAGLHAYTEFYEQFLRDRRGEALRILEIGVGGNEDEAVGGHSLRMWRDYFPRATIVGLDLYDKKRFESDRIVIEQGDQSDPNVLQNLHDSWGPFDLIIDDGSHLNSHVVTTFRILFPLLRAGGIYVIEDLQTSYWPTWGGSYLNRSRWTSMNFLKDRVDGLNLSEFRRPVVLSEPTDGNIIEIRFRHNIAALFKSDGLSRSPSRSQTGWRGVIQRGGRAQLRNAVHGNLARLRLGRQRSVSGT